MKLEKADICLILEGTYPYVSGGVSSWTHTMIESMPEKTFHLLCILPPDGEPELKFDLPSNVIGVSNVELTKLPSAVLDIATATRFNQAVEAPLSRLIGRKGDVNDFEELIRLMRSYEGALGDHALMQSEASWELVQRMYLTDYEESSFLDYFWSWRGLMGSIYSILMAPLPAAGAYHAISTGYAGLMAARAKIETGRPTLLTEHGIYTNERRIEVASAEWLQETASKSLTIDHTRNNLRDFWEQSFASFSRICYHCCDKIFTLYEGNRQVQIADGADPKKIQIIVNGIELDRFAAVTKEPHDRATIGLIGRVVHIKDIKNFIRAASHIHGMVPDSRILIIGPTEEEPEYYHECKQMVEYMGLKDTVTFTGKVDITQYLGKLDVLVLSSLSEAMPLTILEAGAAGIPCVSTDVGACSEILYGREPDDKAIGNGGIITPLSNPSRLANAILELLADSEKRTRYGQNLKQRVQRHYDIKDQIASYRAVYDACTDSGKRAESQTLQQAG